MSGVRPFVLVILDGWGDNPDPYGNAIAAARNPRAALLSPEIARSLGVGNSSGQGMCVALQRWPHWVSTWLTVKEAALAYAKSRPVAGGMAVTRSTRRRRKRRRPRCATMSNR